MWSWEECVSGKKVVRSSSTELCRANFNRLCFTPASVFVRVTGLRMQSRAKRDEKRGRGTRKRKKKERKTERRQKRKKKAKQINRFLFIRL